MNLQLSWAVHTLPLWFLVFSLFLPRLALLVYWSENATLPMQLHGWIPLAAAILLPRALILYVIYMDQGLSLWVIVHLIAAIGVWSASGRAGSRRSHE